MASRTVRKMCLDATQAIDMHSLKGADVRSVCVYRYMDAPEICLTALAFERVFRACGVSIKRVERVDCKTVYVFKFSHRGVAWSCTIKREEVAEFYALTADQLALPEPSVRINATQQLLLGSST